MMLTDEQLELLISSCCQDASTSTPQQTNFETIGSSSYPIVIDDQDAADNDGDFIITDLKEETNPDVSIRIVASPPDGLHRTYSAMDVVQLRQSDSVGLTAEHFDDDEIEKDLIVNSAIMEADGNVADMDDVHEGELYKTQADFKRALRA